MNVRNHPLYGTWNNIMRRCYAKYHANYKYYGAKGITVAKQWHKFRNFVYDIDNRMPNGHLLYRKDYQLDKDLKGGKIYSLENCVVMSSEENNRMNNMSSRKPILAIKDGKQIEFESILNASKELNITRSVIQYNLKSGRKTRSGYTFRYIG